MSEEKKVHNKRARTAPPGAVYVGRPSPWGNPFRDWKGWRQSNRHSQIGGNDTADSGSAPLAREAPDLFLRSESLPRRYPAPRGKQAARTGALSHGQAI